MRDAISVSSRIEYHTRGIRVQSVNRRVARDTLKLAKTQQEYGRTVRQEILAARLSKKSSIPSEGSSPQPGPSRRRGPQPSPPPSVVISLPHEPPVPTGDAGRRPSSIAVDATPSVVSVPRKPGQPRNARAKAPHREFPPMSKNVETDMGHRIASTFTPRRERGSRVRDADRNVVWREHHQGDDGGQ